MTKMAKNQAKKIEGGDNEEKMARKLVLRTL